MSHKKSRADGSDSKTAPAGAPESETAARLLLTLQLEDDLFPGSGGQNTGEAVAASCADAAGEQTVAATRNNATRHEKAASQGHTAEIPLKMKISEAVDLQAARNTAANAISREGNAEREFDTDSSEDAARLLFEMRISGEVVAASASKASGLIGSAKGTESALSLSKLRKTGREQKHDEGRAKHGSDTDSSAEAAHLLFEMRVAEEATTGSAGDRRTDRARVLPRVPLRTLRWKRREALLLHTGVTALLERELGKPVRHVDTTEIAGAKQEKRIRKICRLTFESQGPGGGRVEVVAKTGILHRREYVARKEAWLSSLRLPEFRVPRFYGLVDLGHGDKGGVVGVWEFVKCERPSVLTINANLDRIARAAAALAAVTPEALIQIPDFRTKNRFLAPKAETVRSFLAAQPAGDPDVEQLKAKAEQLAAIESKALERLGSLPKFVAHSDLAGDNMFLPPEGPIVILDWESASLAPVGACLRSFARRDDLIQLQMAELFATTMGSKGFEVSYEDVLFGMRSIEIFRALWYGTDQSHPKAAANLRWALDHLDYLVAG